MKIRRSISTLFSLVFILSSVFVLFTVRPVQAEPGVFSISSNRLLQDKENTNLYYFVGMVYYEVWSNSAGNWTGAGHHPNSNVPEVDGGIYEFTFASNRKVKSISVEQFKYDWKSPDGKLLLGDLTFEKSRTGELKKKS